jgi:WD40 repeat protein
MEVILSELLPTVLGNLVRDYVRDFDGSGVEFSGHILHINSVIQLKDGLIVSGSWDNALRLWNLDGKCEVEFKGHTDCVNYVIQLKDGRIVSCSEDNTMRLWGFDM